MKRIYYAVMEGNEIGVSDEGLMIFHTKNEALQYVDEDDWGKDYVKKVSITLI